jgi:hypothetical protein
VGKREREEGRKREKGEKERAKAGKSTVASPVINKAGGLVLQWAVYRGRTPLLE